jgi:hypothetical protein
MGFVVSRVPICEGPGASATARVDARSAGGPFNIPGPQKRGTGATLNLIKFRMRQGHPFALGQWCSFRIGDYSPGTEILIGQGVLNGLPSGRKLGLAAILSNYALSLFRISHPVLSLCFGCPTITEI